MNNLSIMQNTERTIDSLHCELLEYGLDCFSINREMGYSEDKNKARFIFKTDSGTRISMKFDINSSGVGSIRNAYVQALNEISRLVGGKA